MEQLQNKVASATECACRKALREIAGCTNIGICPRVTLTTALAAPCECAGLRERLSAAGLLADPMKVLDVLNERDGLRADLAAANERAEQLSADLVIADKRTAAYVRHRDAALKGYKEAVDTLRALQWRINLQGVGWSNFSYCPSCEKGKEFGHAKRCLLAAIIARFDAQ